MCVCVCVHWHCNLHMHLPAVDIKFDLFRLSVMPTASASDLRCLSRWSACTVIPNKTFKSIYSECKVYSIEMHPSLYLKHLDLRQFLFACDMCVVFMFLGIFARQSKEAY